MLEACSGI